MKVIIKENSAEQILVALQGELDTPASQQFAKDMEPVMENADKQITLDFTELEYISSTGLRTILLLQKTAQDKGGKVQIKGMSDEIKQIFELTGFDQIIELL